MDEMKLLVLLAANIHISERNPRMSPRPEFLAQTITERLFLQTPECKIVYLKRFRQ